jgi:hypothetical protein
MLRFQSLIAILILGALAPLASATALPEPLKSEYLNNCKDRISKIPYTNHNLQAVEKICECIAAGFAKNATVTAAQVRALVTYRKKYGNSRAPEGTQHSEELDLILDFEGQLYYQCLDPAG